MARGGGGWGGVILKARLRPKEESFLTGFSPEAYK